MFFSNGNDLINSLNTGQTISGLDLGDKTIGVAVSDKNLIVGTPIKTISRKGGSMDINELKAIFEEFNVGAIVLGFPLNLDGKENIRTKKTREFGEKISLNLSLSIYLQDERFSTDVVFKELKNKSFSKQKIKKYIDKMSASYILQGFLDKYSNNINFTNDNK